MDRGITGAMWTAFEQSTDRIVAAEESSLILILKKEIEKLRGRLKAYEDTGLTPEEVSALVKDWSDLCTIVGECGGLDRVRALAEADKDGRVVVRPYRIDAAVYVLVKDEAVFYPETNGWYIGKETIGAITQNGFYLGDPEEGSFEPNDEIGKTVFLTYEEAAQALEGRNG